VAVYYRITGVEVHTTKTCHTGQVQGNSSWSVKSQSGQLTAEMFDLSCVAYYRS